MLRIWHVVIDELEINNLETEDEEKITMDIKRGHKLYIFNTKIYTLY